MTTSIVTISFNQRPFLERALLSVLRQDSRKQIQYIVVDPGSTDGSRELIERYRSEIDVIVYELDSGPADGLNKGFSKASGEILGFLNSDDELLPGAVRRIDGFFADHPSVDVVSGNAVAINATGTELRILYSDRFSARAYAYGACVLVQPSTFFRAQAFFATHGFNPRNHCTWDGELFLDLAEAGAQFATIPDVLSRFRIHGGGITGSQRLQSAIDSYRTATFRRVIGREKNALDTLLHWRYLIAKHARNPTGLVERLRKGSLASYGPDPPQPIE